MVEIECGLAADIEGFPVEEGLGGGLLDVDIVAGGGGGVGTFPVLEIVFCVDCLDAYACF